MDKHAAAQTRVAELVALETKNTVNYPAPAPQPPAPPPPTPDFPDYMKDELKSKFDYTDPKTTYVRAAHPCAEPSPRLPRLPR